VVVLLQTPAVPGIYWPGGLMYRRNRSHRSDFPAVVSSGPAMIVGGQPAGGHNGMSGLICCDCGDNPCLDCSQQSSRLHKLRGPSAISGRRATSGQDLGLSCPDAGAALRRNRGGEEAP
jgi:hypothetical protein